RGMAGAACGASWHLVALLHFIRPSAVFRKRFISRTCTPEEPSGDGKVANFELPKRNTGPYFSKIIATEADAPGIFLGFGGGLPHETARLLDLRSPVAAAPRRSGIRTGARSA